jgi:hypothetical protein
MNLAERFAAIRKKHFARMEADLEKDAHEMKLAVAVREILYLANWAAIFWIITGDAQKTLVCACLASSIRNIMSITKAEAKQRRRRRKLDRMKALSADLKPINDEADRRLAASKANIQKTEEEIQRKQKELQTLINEQRQKEDHPRTIN